MQQNQTNVRCPRCHEAFRLSADDSMVFLREMRINVECPVCVQQVFFSVLPGATSENINTPVSAKTSGKSKTINKPKGPTGLTKVGMPPFKPLGKEPAPVLGAEATRSIPFAQIQASKDKSARNEPASEKPANRKGWWGSQNQTTQVLIVLVAILCAALAVLMVLLLRKPVANPQANPKPGTGIHSGSSGQTGGVPKDSGILIPSETSGQPNASQKKKD